MYQSSEPKCHTCDEAVNLNKDSYRKITDMKGKTRFWHNDKERPEKACWDKWLNERG